MAPGSRSHTVQAAPRAFRRSTTTGSASGGMKTSRWRSAARATTAAARAALPQEAIARGARSTAGCPAVRSPAGCPAAGSAADVPPAIDRWRASSTASSRSVPKRWRALCEPDTLPVSSLTQTPPAAEKPRASESGPLRMNGVIPNPWPSTRATAVSSRCTRPTYSASLQPTARARLYAWNRVRQRTYGLGAPVSSASASCPATVTRTSTWSTSSPGRAAGQAKASGASSGT